MKYLLLFFKFSLLFVFNVSNAQDTISIVSWNLKNLGKSKDATEMEYIAHTLKAYDVVAIQEVVAGPEGPKAVARLHDELNRKGAKWDYRISDPTSTEGNKSERYAFLWKTSRAKLVGDAWLEAKYHKEIEREPYFIRLQSTGGVFTLVNFHAITKADKPETEIKYFRFLPERYRSHRLIFAGDFNLAQSHSVFNPLKKMGFSPVLQGQKTSLRQACIDGDCLASEFDNIFLQPSRFTLHGKGIVPFYQAFDDLKQARLISDHVPVFIRVSLN
jgi:deoxyribonuclease-1-like protein